MNEVNGKRKKGVKKGCRDYRVLFHVTRISSQLIIT